jgi:hypothetical protein
VRVEGRVHFELAETREEAENKTREYLESWGYTDIKITDAHEETEEEKYGKGHPFASISTVNTEPVEEPEPKKSEELKVEETVTGDELF